MVGDDSFMVNCCALVGFAARMLAATMPNDAELSTKILLILAPILIFTICLGEKAGILVLPQALRAATIFALLIALMLTGVPQFPPIEGLDEAVWKKQCTSCHKWDQRTLCEQAASYVKNPKSALRGLHPYGGAEKVAMMQWAKTGCQ